MSQALYRKYRSRSLDDVVGQDHITSLLRRAISSGNIAHAYLLTGPRGVGKTSVARIIAHAINGLDYQDESDHLDIIEIDAASNNGVEDVRDLRDKVHIAPSSAVKKIYIIDEVHMLSKAAFNALLKTLEEPPSHVVFILATTDVDKLPATIVSRVQQFNFRAIPATAVSQHLRYIADQESIAIDDLALDLVARHGGGSFRDSISLLDQLRHSVAEDQTITVSDVRDALGATDDERIEQLIASYRAADVSAIVGHIKDLEAAGVYPGIVTKQLIDRLQQTIIDYPADIRLLDSLLEVTSSTYPFIKLLAALTVDLDLPTRRDVTPATVAPKPDSQTAKPVQSTASRQKKSTQAPEANSRPDDQLSSYTEQSQTAVSTEVLDWQALLEEVDTPLRSLLAPSGHSQDGDKLTIYAGTKFKAKQLTSSKQQSKLQAALQKIGAADLTLDIRGEKAPPRDSQTAAVAAIMGGGEEVAYDG